MINSMGMATMDPLIGTMVGDRYVIARELGRGGMGVVYGATQRDLEREVAVKVLFQTNDPMMEERLLREARAAGSIGHPNVVDVYDLGRLADGRPYLVMPLLHGHDLATELADGLLPKRSRALWILAETARGLDVLHAKGLVHRDLKPENLFLASHADGSEALKILDFGLATRAQDVRLTNAGFTSGSPHYMPPEAADGSVPDRRGDVYSLASIAYELLSGRTPFDGETPFAILTQKTTRAAPRMSTRQRPFSTEVEAVMARGLARDPNERYANAGTFVATLDRAFGADAAPVPAHLGASRSTLEVESLLFSPPEPALPRVEPRAPQPRSTDTTPVLLAARQDEVDEPGSTLPTQRGPVFAVAGGLVLALCGAIAVFLWQGRDGTSAPATPTVRGATAARAEPAPHDSTVPEPVTPQPLLAETGVEPSVDQLAAMTAEPGGRRPGARGGPRGTSPPPAAAPVIAVATEPPVVSPVVPPPPPIDAPVVRAPAAEPAPPGPDVARAEELTRAATRKLVQGALGDALEQFRAATLAAPRHAPAWRGLALTNERAGRAPEAVRAYRRYLELAPNAGDAEEIRARVARLGD